MCTLHLFEWPSHRLFGLNLMANPFWLDLPVRRKRSITTGKWENNCAAQHRLWSIHLDTTWLVGRVKNVLAERKQCSEEWKWSVINKGGQEVSESPPHCLKVTGSRNKTYEGKMFSILLLNDKAYNTLTVNRFMNNLLLYMYAIELHCCPKLQIRRRG